MVAETITGVVRRYLAALPGYGIHPARAVLFGSFARGAERPESDIDLVVIAPEFDASLDDELDRRLWRATLAADVRIEPIPCGVREWEAGTNRLIVETARREGVVVDA